MHRHDNAEEIWLAIPGWEGLYSASSAGRIRGDRSGRVLRPSTHRYTGHQRVQLYRDGRAVTRLVHRLVLATFVGPCPDGMECCHNDGDSKNNRVDNLRWDTRTSNMADTIAHGTRQRGVRHYRTDLTNQDIRSIRDLYRCGMVQREIGERFGISQGAVSLIISGRRWGHVP